jgi:large subunit ribosomal protein L35
MAKSHRMKTHKGMKKRFRVTGTGKVSRKQAGKSHLLVSKSAKRRRRLRGNRVLGKTLQKKALQLLGPGL